jgi:hypothetical protein
MFSFIINSHQRHKETKEVKSNLIPNRECEIVLAIALLQESLGYTNFFKFKTLSEFQKSIDYSNQDMISMIT